MLAPTFIRRVSLSSSFILSIERKNRILFCHYVKTGTEEISLARKKCTPNAFHISFLSRPSAFFVGKKSVLLLWAMPIHLSATLLERGKRNKKDG